MGLLKNLMDIVGKETLSKVRDAVNTMINEQVQGTPAKSPSAAKVDWDAPVPEKTESEWRDYFRGIIQAEFPFFSLRENVPVTEIAGPIADEFQLYKTRPRQAYRAEWGQPYTFVLYEGAAPKGVVMLGSGHSHDANVKYLIARMFAKKSGLPYINFYTQMANERSYVAGRLKRFLQ